MLPLKTFLRVFLDVPFVSTLNWQKSKFKPEAMKELFKEFNLVASSIPSAHPSRNFRCIASDDSMISFSAALLVIRKSVLFLKATPPKVFQDPYKCLLWSGYQYLFSNSLAVSEREGWIRRFMLPCRLPHSTFGCLWHFYWRQGDCSYNNMVHVIEKNSTSFSEPRTYTAETLPAALIIPVLIFTMSLWM